MATTMVHIPGLGSTGKPKVKFKMPNIGAAILRHPIASLAVGAGALGAASIIPARKKAKTNLPRVEALISEYKRKKQSPERAAALSQLQGHKEMLENVIHRPKRTAAYRGMAAGLMAGSGAYVTRYTLRARQRLLESLGGRGARAEASVGARAKPGPSTRKPPSGGSGKVIDVKPVSVESKVAAAKMAGLGSELLRAYTQHPYLTGMGLGAAGAGLGAVLGGALRPKAKDWAEGVKEGIREKSLEQRIEPTYAGQVYLANERKSLAEVQAAERFPWSERMSRYRKAITGGAVAGLHGVATVKAMEGVLRMGAWLGKQ